MSIVERTLSKLQQGQKDEAGRISATKNTVPRIGAVLGVPAPGPEAAQDGSPGRHTVQSRVVKLDRNALRSVGLLPPEADETRLAIEYRHIKRPLIREARRQAEVDSQRARFIMVASAIPAEGKTFTAINLALSLSLEKDLRVLLVDGDVAKGHISQLLGLDHEKGLLDALSDRNLSPESVILPTDVPGMSILPSGTKQVGATELLASGRMQEVLHAIAGAYPSSLVVLDSPPLLLTTESRALASLVGQIVVVVKAGSTPRHVIEKALDALVEHEHVSLVLNQCATSSGQGYYEYGVYAQD